MPRAINLGVAEPEPGGAIAPDAPRIPPWVSRELRREAGAEPTPVRRSVEGHELTIVDAGRLAFGSVRVPHAAELSSGDFRSAVSRAYTSLVAALDRLRARRRLRFWNFIPAIRSVLDGGGDKYHVFNEGRYEALARLPGGGEAFDRLLPAATGVGHDGTDLVVHCLAGEAPGLHVENPRQVPAYRYSARYGPRPPCFARGTVVALGGPVVLIGGTSSVRGEESIGAFDTRAQLGETRANLESLIRAAFHAGSAESAGGGGDAGGAPADPLACFTEARVYYTRAADRSVVESEVRRMMPRTAAVELVRADICRAELLVEIEGVAELGRPRGEGR